MSVRKIVLSAFLSSLATLVSATTPVVVVQSPTSGGSVGSPVNFVASASSSGCSKGIAAMRIYTAPGVGAYTVDANSLNANINLPVGSYNTVVQAWDNCGGVGKTTVNINVSKINLAPPKFLYATEFEAGRIAEYVVNPLTGSVTPTSQGSVWAHWGPVDIASDLGGYRLYVANQGSHDLDAYFINRDNGSLIEVPGSPFALAATGLRVVVHPSGDFVYATSSSSSSSDINAFAVQSNGSLTPIPGSPFALSGTTGALAMDPSGKYLYVEDSASGGAGAVAGYTIDETNGALTPIPGSPFPTPAYPGCALFCSDSPTDLGVDPTSNYLYGTESGQDSIAGFKIDPATGTLTSLPGSPYAEGFYNVPGNSAHKSPWRLSIDPSDKYIYVADPAGNDFTVYKLNGSTGVPTFEASIGNSSSGCLPGLAVPLTVFVDPSGSFVYSQGDSSTGCGAPPGTTNALIGYSLNQGNGYLQSVPGSPFANPNLHTSNSSEEKVVVTR
jgi:6-phosphogluconolactonase (cycloisomerase 2 family)